MPVVQDHCFSKSRNHILLYSEMKIQEHQTKELFSRYGVPTDKCVICNNVEEALYAYRQLPKQDAVLIAQVPGGGKKTRSIKYIHSEEELQKQANAFLHSQINGLPVTRLLVGEVISVFSEYYLSLVADRKSKSALLVLSPEGGTNLDEIMHNAPGKIYRFSIDNAWGMTTHLAKQAASTLFSDALLVEKMMYIIKQLYKLFVDNDACLVEINSLALTTGGELIVIDARIDMNDNVLYLHPDMGLLSNPVEEEKKEAEARTKGFSYVHLDGDIACVVNGSGIIPNTLEMMRLAGGRPASFLDIGACTNPDKIIDAMRFLFQDKQIKVVLVYIFGGLACCVDAAKNLLSAFSSIKMELPVIVHLRGTNEKEGRSILRGGPFQIADTMEQAIRMAVDKTIPDSFYLP